MTSIAELRKNRKSSFQKITESMDNDGGSGKQKDDRFWKLERDAAGNGSAVIRFLPPVAGDELPWVRLYQYAFQGPSGRWYINESPTTIGNPCPVADSNRELYATKDEAQIAIAKTRKRKTYFISNILVIKDPAHPENEGKTFLFKYGKQIHEMITSKARPEFDDDTPIEVWDIDEGANFKLRIKVKDKYPTYESSEFTAQSSLCDGDEDEMQRVIDSTYRLNDFVDPSKFKSYADLSAELTKVMTAAGVRRAADSMNDEGNDGENQPAPQSSGRYSRVNVEKVSKEPVAPKAKATEKVSEPADPDGDDMSYFQSLLND